MTRIYVILFTLASLFAFEAQASFNYWYFGSGPGSYRYWISGTGPGSRTFWLSSTEDAPGSRRRWMSPTGGEGSSRQWFGTSSVYPSLRHWNEGFSVGSMKTWNSPQKVTGSRQAWLSNTTQPVLPWLTVVLCKAGVISIDPCRYMPEVPTDASYFAQELYRLQCLGESDANANVESSRIQNIEQLRNNKDQIERERNSHPNDMRVVPPLRVVPR